MFTGIIQEVGTIVMIRKAGTGIQLTVESPRCAPDLDIGASVAISGVCQTVIDRSDDRFTVNAVEETLSKTTLGSFVSGNRVNVETALQFGGRMGGHLVQGHVDAVASISSLEEKTNGWMLGITLPDRLVRYVVPVGSIAVDGISFTVAAISDNVVTVAVIPHTMKATTLADARVGSKVNIECDVIGKYVEKMVFPYGVSPGKGVITSDMLRSWGYDEE
jgi:riboflavin synthase